MSASFPRLVYVNLDAGSVIWLGMLNLYCGCSKQIVELEKCNSPKNRSAMLIDESPICESRRRRRDRGFCRCLVRH